VEDPAEAHLDHHVRKKRPRDVVVVVDVAVEGCEVAKAGTARIAPERRPRVVLVAGRAPVAVMAHVRMEAGPLVALVSLVAFAALVAFVPLVPLVVLRMPVVIQPAGTAPLVVRLRRERRQREGGRQRGRGT
jgi:hypothetical protein